MKKMNSEQTGSGWPRDKDLTLRVTSGSEFKHVNDVTREIGVQDFDWPSDNRSFGKTTVHILGGTFTLYAIEVYERPDEQTGAWVAVDSDYDNRLDMLTSFFSVTRFERIQLVAGEEELHWYVVFMTPWNE